jgi:FixJ family two-component response regulator
MPGLSAVEVRDRLIAEGHRISIILLTGYPDENVRKRAMKGGALAFLSKPLDHHDLVDHLEKALKAS